MSNQTKKISLLDLKYTKLRKKIGEVEIYNPDKELKLEIEKEFMHRIAESFNEDNPQINFTVYLGEILTMFIPLLTNLDCPEDVLLINEILADPSPLLEKVIDEVSIVLREIFERAAKKIIQTQQIIDGTLNDEDLTDEQKVELLKEMEIVISGGHIKDEDILISDEELGDLDEI